MDKASDAINQPDWVRFIARIVYPLALAGAALAAVLNAVSWLPIDVDGLTPVWVLLFVGIFPVFFAVILVITREQRLRRDRLGPARWWQSGRLSWRDAFAGAPRWAVVLLLIVAAYAYINFFAGIAQLPGQPETAGGLYYFTDHGRQMPTDLAGYLQGLRVQMRMFTGHPMVFYGIAALVMVGRRRPV